MSEPSSTASASTVFIPEGTSEFQAKILADGAVSDAEFSAALHATVDCMRRLGIDASVSAANSGIQYVTNTTEEYEAATRASDECGAEYSWDVESRYALGHPSGVDPGQYAQCLIDAGLLAEGSSGDPLDLQRAAAQEIDTAYACLNSVE